MEKVQQVLPRTSIWSRITRFWATAGRRVWEVIRGIVDDTFLKEISNIAKAKFLQAFGIAILVYFTRQANRPFGTLSNTTE